MKVPKRFLLILSSLLYPRIYSQSCPKENAEPDLEEPYEIDWHLNSMDQEDPKLISIIKERYLVPPFSSEKYNFTVPLDELQYHAQFGQPVTIDRQIFKGKLRSKEARRNKKYFFVEAGAYNGELISNTLHYEIRRGWTGLLIEPNPDYFKDLLKKKRKAWSFGRCISTKRTPEVVEFDASGLLGGIISKDGKKPGYDIGGHVHRRTLRLQCFPLYSVLSAVGNPTVHYLSLDIEGAELQVLNTLPFEKIDIKVLDIETNHLGEIFPGNIRDLASLLGGKGFRFHSNVGVDSVFVKNGFSVDKIP